MLLFNPGIIKIQRKLIFFFFIIAITAFASKAQAKTPEVNFEGFYSVAGPLLGVLGVDHDEAKKCTTLG